MSWARTLVLTFHGLGEPPQELGEAERRVWVPVEWFEAIADRLPRRGVELAFDDGNASDVEHALPALSQRGMTAHFFVLAGRIDVEGYLSASDVSSLHTAGMGIGSHGLHHRDWRTLGTDELVNELVVSRRTLAEIIGEHVLEAACPFGSYDRRVLRAARAAGYRRIYNSDGGAGSAQSWLVPRTTVNRSRPLEYWLDIAAAGAAARPSPMLLGKRLIKRLR